MKLNRYTTRIEQHRISIYYYYYLFNIHQQQQQQQINVPRRKSERTKVAMRGDVTSRES